MQTFLKVKVFCLLLMKEVDERDIYIMKTVIVKDVTLGSGRPKIIVPLVGHTEQQLFEEIKAIQEIECDLVEWRADFFDKVEDTDKVIEVSQQITKLLKNKPVLFTFRTKQEGGERVFSDEAYFQLYRSVIKAGTVDMIDVELFMEAQQVDELIRLAHEKEIKVVMCNHDFEKTPPKETIIQRLQMMQEKEADICKIAVMPQNSEDVLTVLQATNEIKQLADRPIVTMAMGQLGMISRLSGEVFGSAMTFGAVKQTSAPGQIPVAQLKTMLNTLSLE